MLLVTSRRNRCRQILFYFIFICTILHRLLFSAFSLQQEIKIVQKCVIGDSICLSAVITMLAQRSRFQSCPPPFLLVYRFAFTAMSSGSHGGPNLAEAYLGLLSVGVKGAVGDACLTGWLQRGWADTTACVRAVPGHRPDHVAGYVQRPSVAFTPATSARDCDHHPLCSSLVDTMFLLVLHKDDQPEILPNSDHPVWETARP